MKRKESRSCSSLKCCFTSTETVGLLGTGAYDVHLDFHTAPGLGICRLMHGHINYIYTGPWVDAFSKTLGLVSGPVNTLWGGISLLFFSYVTCAVIFADFLSRAPTPLIPAYPCSEPHPSLTIIFHHGPASSQRSAGGDVGSVVGCHPVETPRSCRVASVVSVQ